MITMRVVENVISAVIGGCGVDLPLTIGPEYMKMRLPVKEGQE